MTTVVKKKMQPMKEAKERCGKAEHRPALSLGSVVVKGTEESGSSAAVSARVEAAEVPSARWAHQPVTTTRGWGLRGARLRGSLPSREGPPKRHVRERGPCPATEERLSAGDGRSPRAGGSSRLQHCVCPSPVGIE